MSNPFSPLGVVDPQTQNRFAKYVVGETFHLGCRLFVAVLKGDPNGSLEIVFGKGTRVAG